MKGCYTILLLATPERWEHLYGKAQNLALNFFTETPNFMKVSQRD